MATTGDLIDFDVIENQKENIQALPSGRSAKLLAATFSIISPSHTQDINDVARQAFEKELTSIDEADDPLDVFDRYVKWTLDTYPTTQATSQSELLPLLERATKTFLSSSHHKNDPRYLKLWLQYIRLFSDAPRETFAYLSRHGVGKSLALFYEEFAAWLEVAERWTQAEEVYQMGIQNTARPVERLVRKFGEFQRRRQALPQVVQEPSSPAMPTVRPALAAKLDPFTVASPTAADPQAQSRAGPTAAKKSKLEIFSDDGQVPQLPSTDSSRGWENIGTLAERRKENVVGAQPWLGETIKSTTPRVGAMKMPIFKDQSILQSSMLNALSNHSTRDQAIVNSRSKRTERVAVNLELVYPNPQDPTEEYCFEELRAASRGWLHRVWTPEKQEILGKQEKGALVDISLPNSPQIPPDLGKLVSPPTRKQKLIVLNDANDENMHPKNSTARQEAEAARSLRRDEKANRTRKIKVREVKAESQTIQTNLSSPKGSKIKRKKAAEPTMTLHTKAATDEIYELFNQPLKSEEVHKDSESEGESGSEDDEDDDDDDYTSVGDNTSTGRISANTSEYGEETQGDMASQHADEAEDPADNTGWTEFDTKKDLLKVTADEDASPTDLARELNPDNDEVEAGELTTPTSPSPVMDNQQTRFVPIPPENYEPHRKPYRDSNVMAQNRLPFMTPIVEKTESSLGCTTGHNKSFSASKAPCARGPQTTPTASKYNNDLGSSPFQDFEDEATKDKIAQPKLSMQGLRIDSEEQDDPIKGLVITEEKLEPLRAEPPVQIQKQVLPARPVVKAAREPVSKGPVIKDTQCNPCDENVRKTILEDMQPSLSSLEGFFDRTDLDFNHKTELRKYCKSKGFQSTQSPPLLDFVGADRKYSIRRELGAGAFAPVYLAEQAVEATDNEKDEGSQIALMGKGQFDHLSRRRLEAVKMEEPPSAWEFYMLRTAKRRLGVSRAADSIIYAYEMHLFRDEGYLIEEYRDQGTLLDLVNIASKENGSSGGMDEVLAMFFAVELLRTVEGLHAKGIIHGDLKADNVLVRFDGESQNLSSSITSSHELVEPYKRNGDSGWSSKGIALIDFGRGIDMRAFAPNVQFIADWPTSATDCAEMRELRPWTYQADYHGVAAMLHTLLFGRYIETVADKSGGLGAGAAKTYRLKESLKRYWQTELWGQCFALLLNSGRRTEGEEGGRLPCLKGLKAVREAMEVWLEENSERGVGLRSTIRRMESAVAARKRKD